MSTVAHIDDMPAPAVVYHPTILAGDRPGQWAADRIIGEPQRLADRVQRDLSDIGTRWLRDLLQRTRDRFDPNRPASVSEVVGSWARETISQDEDFPRRIRRWALHGDMGGRLLVAGIELGDDKIVTLQEEPDPIPGLEAFFDQDF